jgi:glycosyltransferase involved in cell wall biosynthesis
LTIGHSYVVALNRRLPQEIARVSEGEWQVTTVAPRFVRAELRDIALEPQADEGCQLESISAYGTNHLHWMVFEPKLREILRRGWDMVHIYQEPYIFAGWQAAWWTPKSTALVFFVAQNLTKKYPPPFSWMERYGVDRCSGWIGCGNTVIDALSRKGYDKRPHRRIGFGVDTDIFRPDPLRKQEILRQLGWDDSVPVVAFLGRFTEEKGIDMLPRALDSVRLPWRALFVGSGPEGGMLAEWAAKHGNAVRIVAATHGEVPGYLNAVDILCAPSQSRKNWREQFGRMVIEAFASQVAVIGSDSGEIPYVIGDAGLVVAESDQAAWTTAIERLLGDPSLRQTIAARGRQRVLDEFTWPVIARKHIEFFDEILAERELKPLKDATRP